MKLRPMRPKPLIATLITASCPFVYLKMPIVEPDHIAKAVRFDTRFQGLAHIQGLTVRVWWFDGDRSMAVEIMAFNIDSNGIGQTLARPIPLAPRSTNCSG